MRWRYRDDRTAPDGHPFCQRSDRHAKARFHSGTDRQPDIRHNHRREFDGACVARLRVRRHIPGSADQHELPSQPYVASMSRTHHRPGWHVAVPDNGGSQIQPLRPRRRSARLCGWRDTASAAWKVRSESIRVRHCCAAAGAGAGFLDRMTSCLAVESSWRTLGVAPVVEVQELSESRVDSCRRHGATAGSRRRPTWPRDEPDPDASRPRPGSGHHHGAPQKGAAPPDHD